MCSFQYLGNRTTEKVKKRCIEILYGWYKGLSHEPKIGEAYHMLKAQGIIKEDPVYVTKVFVYGAFFFFFRMWFLYKFSLISKYRKQVLP